jgi:regulation of enolase protein 1 (concanavalin A-like superfamily)
MEWLNEPPNWSNSGNQIIVKTAAKTDFWRITHYGFIRHNGHFYFEQVQGDFVVEVKIRGNYKDLYDQAGIMIRANEQHWIKTGIEYVDGIQNLSAVVTHDYSDWSFTPLPSSIEFLQLRVERRNEAIHISYIDESLQVIPFRMTYFPGVEMLQVGIMCASPEGDGYQVIFEDFQLSQLNAG